MPGRSETQRGDVPRPAAPNNTRPGIHVGKGRSRKEPRLSEIGVAGAGPGRVTGRGAELPGRDLWGWATSAATPGNGSLWGRSVVNVWRAEVEGRGLSAVLMTSHSLSY